MTKLPEMRQLSDSSDQGVVYGYTEAQMLQFRRDALEEALQCYSQEDTASDYIGKILDLKDET